MNQVRNVIYFVTLTIGLMIFPSLSGGQRVSGQRPSPEAAQPAAKPSCFTQTGTDLCTFQGPAGDNSSIKIASGLKYMWTGTAGEVVRRTTKGAYKEYPVPSGGTPFGFALGPDKRMWFAEYNTGNVGAITAAGRITEYPLGFSPSDAIDITQGSDKNLWMSSDFNGIIRITPTGQVTTFSLPDGNGAQPSSVTLGPDGNIWFLEANGPCFEGADYTNIGKVTPSGVITEYPVGLHGNGFGIAGGPDGRIWFADPGGCDSFDSRIGAVNTDGSGLNYYTAGLPPYVDTIINGGDGNLYFGTFTSQVGRITPAGVVTVWDLPSNPAFPVLGMTIGPDTNVWFSDNSGGAIGAIYIHPVVGSFSPASGPVGTKVKIKGYGFTPTTKVTFDGVLAAFTVNSGIQLTATVPAGAATGKITVTAPGGSSTSKKAFTVN